MDSSKENNDQSDDINKIDDVKHVSTSQDEEYYTANSSLQNSNFARPSTSTAQWTNYREPDNKDSSPDDDFFLRDNEKKTSRNRNHIKEFSINFSKIEENDYDESVIYEATKYHDDSLEITKDKLLTSTKRSFSDLSNQDDEPSLAIKSESESSSSVEISKSKDHEDDEDDEDEESTIVFPPPIAKKLKKIEIFDYQTNLPRHEVLKKHFLGEGRLEEEAALEIIRRATYILRKEPNVIRIDDDLTLCGDIHGQYYDLMKVLEIGGSPADTNYLFLGDYVDRGSFSIECVLYLWSLKICYPNTFYLLRGNHECRHLTEYFTFKKECEVKYSEAIYEACLKSFDCLPLVGIIKNRFFCVHGGISPNLETIQDIERLNRYKEPDSRGLMCDLLWSDPCEDYGQEEEDLLFFDNTIRGCSYNFSYKACCKFLEKNNLFCIIRAHEAMEDGYKMYRTSMKNGFPTLVTLFSAPNYLDVYNNKGAIIKYKDDNMHIKLFPCSPHPYWLPNFENAISWSLPFLAEKVTDIAKALLNLCPDEEIDSSENDNSIELKRQKIIGNKIKAVAKMARNYKILREEKELVLQLKGLSPNGKLSPGVLSEGKESLHKELQKKLNFLEVKQLDEKNEKLPSVLFENKKSSLKQTPLKSRIPIFKRHYSSKGKNDSISSLDDAQTIGTESFVSQDSNSVSIVYDDSSVFVDTMSEPDVSDVPDVPIKPCSVVLVDIFEDDSLKSLLIRLGIKKKKSWANKVKK